MYASLDLPEKFDAAAAHPRRSPRVIVNGAVVQKTSGMLVQGKRALIMSDIVPLTSGMEGAIDRLEKAGFVVMGNYAGNKASGRSCCSRRTWRCTPGACGTWAR
jgi:hypothetical protein